MAEFNITTPEEWNVAITYIENNNKNNQNAELVTINLLEDLDFSEVEYKIIPSASQYLSDSYCNVTINGNNHIIKNIYILLSNNIAYGVLLPYVYYNFNISNLTFTSCSIQSTGNQLVLIQTYSAPYGVSYKNSINKVHLLNSIVNIGNGEYTFIRASASTDIERCYTKSNIKCSYYNGISQFGNNSNIDIKYCGILDNIQASNGVYLYTASNAYNNYCSYNYTNVIVSTSTEIIGYNGYNCIDCYAVIQQGETEPSTRIGFSTRCPSVQDCFYDNEVSTMDSSGKGEGLTTTQLKDKDFLIEKGWVF